MLQKYGTNLMALAPDAAAAADLEAEISAANLAAAKFDESV